MAIRGRPRSFDRDVALRRAIEVFWARGYEGAQLVELTAAMGINPPSFYAAFGSKEALFREALDRYLATDGAGSMQALDAGATTRSSILGMLTASAEIALASPGARGCMLILGLVNGLPENDGLRLHLAGLRRETTDRIRRRLRRGIEDGDLPAGTDTDGLATFFGTMIQGLSLQARDGASREQLLAAAVAAVKILD